MLRCARRIFSHVTIVALTLLHLTAATVLAQGLEAPDQPRMFDPGAFGVATVVIRGTGTFTVEFEAPEAWSLVTRARSVDVDGSLEVPVVLRVPPDASPEDRFLVTARIRQPSTNEVVAETVIPVEVRALRSIAIDVPRDVEWQRNRLERLQIRVSNRGNTEVVGRLVVRGPSFPVTVSPSQLVLPPGQSSAVTVEARPTGGLLGQSTSRIVLELVGAESNEPVAREVLFILVTSGSGVAGVDDESAEPTLIFGLRSRLGAAVSFGDAPTDWSLSYEFDPRLRGTLSDYVSVDMPLPALSGTPVPAFRPDFEATFQGQAWDANLRTNGRFLAGQYGRTFDEGRWSARASASQAGASVGGSYRHIGDRLEWGLDGGAAIADNGHREQLSAHARIRLSDSFGLDLTADAVGESSAETGFYRVIPTVSQALTWRSGTAYVQQSFGATPTLDRYQGALSAGYSRLGFGVQGRAAIRHRNDLTALTAGVRTTTRLPFRASLALDASLSSDDLTAGAYDARGMASLAGGFRIAAGTSALWSVRYTRSQPLDAARLPGDDGSFALALIQNRFNASIAVSAGRGPEDRSDSVVTRFGVNADIAFAFSPASSATADASWSTNAVEGEREDALDIGVAYRQLLTSTWSSEFAYERADRWSPGGANTLESLAVTTEVTDLFDADLRLAAGYQLASDGGLFADGSTLDHRFEVSIAHALELPFTTPSGVVELFGGRVSGRVAGLLFIDENGDGSRQSDEAPLPSVAITLGDSTFTSDADGRFDVRVPPGDYDFRFGQGLPALVGAVGRPSVEIERDEVQELEIPFAPVAFVEAFVVEAKADEPLSRDLPQVSGLRMRLDGPIESEGRSDADGRIALSGLVIGSYDVSFDVSGLPDGFIVTQRPETIVVEQAGRAPPLLIGVALRAPDVVRGFTSGDLAIRASVLPRQAPPGADIEIEALTQGNPDRVRAEIAGQTIQLEKTGDVWTGTLRLPSDLEASVVQGNVIATRGDVERSARILFRLTSGPLAEFTPSRLGIGPDVEVRVETAFAADRVAIRVGEDTVDLVSSDGRLWTGSVALSSPGTFQWTIAVDDVIVEQEVTVVEP